MERREDQPWFKYAVCTRSFCNCFRAGSSLRAVKHHQAERNAKGFSSWEQFVAMLFCQLAHLNSLREVCMGLASCESPLKHLGISITPKKSTLAYANANRPWELYESIFMQLLEKCQTETAAHCRRKFRFKNKLMSLDGSIIELSATMFDWAKYTQQKGAIKLHLLLDHDGYLPTFAVVTEGKYSELNVARDLRLKAGTILAVDRGYNDYVWFGQLTRHGVFFVTRMKTNTVYTTVEVCAVPEKGNVLSDQIVSVPSLGKAWRDAGSVSANRVLERGQAGNPGFLHQPAPPGGLDGGRDLQGPLANRTVFQSTETNRKSEVVPGHQRQCSQDTDMDGINRHADPEIPADEIQLRLVALQSGRSAAPTAVHLQRLVGMAQRSSGRTASRKATLRTITDAPDVVAQSWTAAKE